MSAKTAVADDLAQSVRHVRLGLGPEGVRGGGFQVQSLARLGVAMNLLSRGRLPALPATGQNWRAGCVFCEVSFCRAVDSICRPLTFDFTSRLLLALL